MSTPPQRATYHHHDLRQALLAHALAAVDDGGAATFSLREAARTIGVSPAAAYRHFADKASLLAAVVDQEFAELASEFTSARQRVQHGHRHHPAAAAAATVFELAAVYVHRAASYSHRFRLAFGSPRTIIGPGEEATREMTTLMRADLVASGAITPEAYARATWVIWPAVHGLASLAADGWVRDADVAVGTQAIVKTVLLGLGVEQATIDHAVDWVSPT